MLQHCLLYVTCPSATHSFTHMKMRRRKFGIVRMGGRSVDSCAWPFTFILVDWDKFGRRMWGFMRGGGTVLARLVGPALSRHSLDLHRAGMASLVMAAYASRCEYASQKAEGAAQSNRLAGSDEVAQQPFVLGLWIITLGKPSSCIAISLTGTFWAHRLKRRPGLSRQLDHPVMTIGQVMNPDHAGAGMTLKVAGARP